MIFMERNKILKFHNGIRVFVDFYMDLVLSEIKGEIKSEIFWWIEPLWCIMILSIYESRLDVRKWQRVFCKLSSNLNKISLRHRLPLQYKLNFSVWTMFNNLCRVIFLYTLVFKICCNSEENCNQSVRQYRNI